MPAGPSRSPRKSGSPAKERTRSNRVISWTPIPGTHSKRTSRRAAQADDALAREKERQITRRLEQIGLVMGEETPVSLGALLRQRGAPLNDHILTDFGDDEFGGFDGDTHMDYDNDNEWESEEELEDDVEKGSQSTEKPSNHAIRTETETNNWTNFIDIATGDTAMQNCSPYCTCTKLTRTLPTVSLTAGVLNYNSSLTVKDISTWNFKYARRLVLFVKICSIS